MPKKSKKTVKVWYKSNCSTCIQVKQLLLDAGYTIDYFEYVKEAIEEEDLTFLIEELGIQPQDLIRKKEPIYKDKYLGKKMSDKQWIKVMIKYPILIERPILLSEGKVFIGRPLEKVIAFCEK